MSGNTHQWLRNYGIILHGEHHGIAMLPQYLFFEDNASRSEDQAQQVHGPGLTEVGLMVAFFFNLQHGLC